MTNKLKYISIVLLLVVLGICIYIGYLYQDILTINKALNEQGWDRSIKNEETEFDYKIGKFYKKVTYDNNEGLEYEYMVNRKGANNDSQVYSYIYDDEGITVEDLSIPYQFPYYDKN